MPTPRSRGRPAHSDILTPAEWRVAEGVRHGMTNRSIAAKLGVSHDAVKFHVANALGKLGFDSRVQLRRWSGVRVDSNLAKMTVSAVEGTGVAAIGQIARSVNDVTAAKRWYEKVLGLPFLYAFGKLAFFDCGGTRLLLSEGDGAAESIIYFRVSDIRAACRALADRGAEFISAPHLIHRHGDGAEEWMAFFHDNEGRPLAIMSAVAAITSIADETGE